MIPAKEAINQAFIYLRDIYPGRVGFELEEVEITDGTPRRWSITISMPDTDNSPINVISGKSRKYKRVLINIMNGDVEAMQIRTL